MRVSVKTLVGVICSTLWFLVCVVLALGLGIPLANLLRDRDAVKIDVSGVGSCNGSVITVDRAWMWTQHPSPLRVEPLRDYTVLKEFKGRNSIVWGGTDAQLVGFDVLRVDGNRITTDRMISIQGECHFTVDKAFLVGGP